LADTAPKDRKPLRPLKADERRASETRARAPKTPASGRRRPLKTRTEEFIGSIALGVSVFDFQDGAIIMESAEEMAEAWSNLADQNPRVKATMERVLTGGAWGGVIMTHGSVIVRIAQNHALFGELTFPVGPGDRSRREENGRGAGGEEPAGGVPPPTGPGRSDGGGSSG
jgi:hypothetical protein